MIAMNGMLLHLMNVVKLLLGLFKFLHLQITFNLLFITLGFFCPCSQRRQFNPITKICIKKGEMSIIAEPKLFHRPIKIPPPTQDRQYYI
jgi:hypothetical protein